MIIIKFFLEKNINLLLLGFLRHTAKLIKKFDVYIAPTTQKIESGNYVCLGRFGRTRFPNLATREKKFSGGREWEGGGEGKESRQFNSIVTKKFYCKAKCLFHFCKIWNKFNLFWTLMLQSCSCRFTRLSGLKMDMFWSMIKDMKELHFQKKPTTLLSVAAVSGFSRTGLPGLGKPTWSTQSQVSPTISK